MAHRSGDRQTPVEVIVPPGWALVVQSEEPSRSRSVRTALFRRCRQSAGARAWVRGVVVAVIWPPQPLTPGRLLAVAVGLLLVGGWRPTVGSVAPGRGGPAAVVRQRGGYAGPGGPAGAVQGLSGLLEARDAQRGTTELN